MVLWFLGSVSLLTAGSVAGIPLPKCDIGYGLTDPTDSLYGEAKEGHPKDIKMQLKNVCLDDNRRTLPKLCLYCQVMMIHSIQVLLLKFI
jgi:hypothetical protein